MKALYQKLHRWPGLVLSIILFFYAVSGIIMNHRNLFASVDIPRSIFPGIYTYNHWNLAAVKGSVAMGSDSLLLYGNLGIVQTDSLLTTFVPFNQGIPQGTDHMKIADLIRTPKGNLYAATLTGLYAWNHSLHQWQSFPALEGTRMTALAIHNDTVWATSRDNIYGSPDQGTQSLFRSQNLQAPEGYQPRVTWFQTLWQLHSGEWLGMPGKLGVDILGIITILLSLTGIFRFIAPTWMKRLRNRGKATTTMAAWNRTSLHWHNQVGAWLVIPLLILFATGIFLRPPLLIAIAGAQTTPIPGTHLDQDNPWYDKLRDIEYDNQRQQWILATSEGFFFYTSWNQQPQKALHQPPVSVMGINVLKPAGDGAFLVGSFSGLFVWNPDETIIWNALTLQPHQPQAGGRPVGDHAISGWVETLGGDRYVMDYANGALPLQGNPMPEMPKFLANAPMSLWNACLEIHTGRILEPLLGPLYILWIPLTGLASIVVTWSGYLLWRRVFRKKRVTKVK